MTEKKHPETAFPVTYGGEDYNCVSEGMTLRDWFAGQALASYNFRRSDETFELDARMCYKMADAMMEERAR